MNSVLYVDAHAHLHGCFALEPALQAAFDNIKHQALSRDVPTSQARGCLMVSELSAIVPEKAARVLLREVAGFTVAPTQEPGSVCVTEESGNCLDVIFGSQIVCDEGLEILVYGHQSPIPAGLSLAATVEAALQQGAMIVLPWGFGKWSGRRGVVLDEFLTSFSQIDGFQEKLYIGDSAARLSLSSVPAALLKAAQLGYKNLPGTDPLPFGTQYRKLGTSGFKVTITAGHDTPLTSIAQALAGVDSQPEIFFKGESVLAFASNQLRMQIRKHSPGKRHAS